MAASWWLTAGETGSVMKQLTPKQASGGAALSQPLQVRPALPPPSLRQESRSGGGAHTPPPWTVLLPYLNPAAY